MNAITSSLATVLPPRSMVTPESAGTAGAIGTCAPGTALGAAAPAIAEGVATGTWDAGPGNGEGLAPAGVSGDCAAPVAPVPAAAIGVVGAPVLGPKSLTGLGAALSCAISCTPQPL